MRITDEGGDEGGYNKPQSSIMDSIKAKSQVSKSSSGTADSNDAPSKWERATGTPAWEQAPKVSGDVQSAKLKQLLGQIKSN
jgi:hypothetical protein